MSKVIRLFLKSEYYPGRVSSILVRKADIKGVEMVVQPDKPEFTNYYVYIDGLEHCMPIDAGSYKEVLEVLNAP